MKVYGFVNEGIQRGEMVATDIDAVELRVYGEAPFAHALNWEHLDTSFARAKQELIARMETAQVASYDIQQVRFLKASHVPVLENSL